MNEEYMQNFYSALNTLAVAHEALAKTYEQTENESVKLLADKAKESLTLAIEVYSSLGGEL